MTWLDRYAADYHKWHRSQDGGRVSHYRPLGIVESAFDADGCYSEGRADISMNASFEISHALSNQDVKRRIVLAWTCLRLHHTLLLAAATTSPRGTLATQKNPNARYFYVESPLDVEDAIKDAEKHMTWLDEHYSHTEPTDFYHDSQNSVRLLDPEESLSRVFIHPIVSTDKKRHSLNFTFIFAHQISDGLTNSRWMKRFLRLLNTPLADLTSSIPDLISSIHTRLPLPQEDLYPPIQGSRARQRWFWAITLVLRNVHKSNPPCFQNPLRRTTPLPPNIPSAKPFAEVLPYTRPPNLNAANIAATLTPSSVRRLHRLCRQSGTSIGAGAFVLVAIVMMNIYECRFPSIPIAERLPFSGSFPINPRPFFDHSADPDSCMLAFSDGVVLPFLPSDLDLDGRIRLLVRSAQRQLSRYQKRARKGEQGREVEIRYWGSNGIGRLVALNYVDAVERVNVKLPKELQQDIPYSETLPRKPGTLATCGVSSVGRGDPEMKPGQYDLDKMIGQGEDAFVADIRGLKMGVRPRDGEFLVGVGGSDDAFGTGVSYDACAIDEGWAAKWKELMESVLEQPEGDRAKL